MEIKNIKEFNRSMKRQLLKLTAQYDDREARDMIVNDKLKINNQCFVQFFIILTLADNMQLSSRCCTHICIAESKE
jgi:hypothetical protein